MGNVVFVEADFFIDEQMSLLKGSSDHNGIYFPKTSKYWSFFCLLE